MSADRSSLFRSLKKEVSEKLPQKLEDLVEPLRDGSRMESIYWAAKPNPSR